MRCQRLISQRMMLFSMSSYLRHRDMSVFNLWYYSLSFIFFQTSHDYLREWFLRREGELQEILNLEGLQDSAICMTCNTTPPAYRCRDCNGGRLYCTECCRSQHQLHPYHRVDHWTGTFFEPSWLWKVGISLDLGHGGAQCHVYNHQPGYFSPEYENDVGNAGEDNEDDEDDERGTAGVGWANPGKPSPAEAHGLKVVTIVHTNGIHHLPIRPCLCPNSPAEDIQMLRMRLYPSTYKTIKTVFTFALLDDYLLENLECQTSGVHYFQKLRRMTNKAFPHLVPVSQLAFWSRGRSHNSQDRYRELLRVGRQWRNLKERKWFGFGHRNQHPKAAEMALFCPACPQSGVNLQQGWKNDGRDWLYWRTLVADGNFVAVHQVQPRGGDDVWIKDGESFMAETGRYQAHLASTVERPEVRACPHLRQYPQSAISNHPADYLVLAQYLQ